MDEVEQVYAQVPKLRCIGKCQEACGPIMMSPVEEQRLEQQNIEVPHAVAMLRAGHATCPHLGPLGSCGIYEQRPLICRLYGTVKAMTCEHGCVPEHWLEDDEAHNLLRTLDRLPVKR